MPGDFDVYHNAKSSLARHVAVFGKQIPIYKGKKITPRYIWSHFQDKPVTNMISDIENRPFLHNAYCYYRRDYLKDYPFDENLSGLFCNFTKLRQHQKHCEQMLVICSEVIPY